jgi:hypothetical protein
MFKLKENVAFCGYRFVYRFFETARKKRLRNRSRISEKLYFSGSKKAAVDRSRKMMPGAINLISPLKIKNI